MISLRCGYPPQSGIQGAGSSLCNHVWAKVSRLAVHSREGASSDKSVMLGRISGSRGQIGLTLEAADKARCRGVDARLATTCKRIVQSTSDPALLLGLLTVSNPKPDDVPKIPSAMGVATRLACSRAVQEGVKVELLLREAGLTRQQIDDPGVRLDVKKHGVDVTIIQPGFIRTPLTEGRTANMPFLMELDAAIPFFVRAIEAKKRFAAFPWQLATIVRAGRFMPSWLYDRVASRARYRE